MKKLLPYLFLLVLAVAALVIRFQCNVQPLTDNEKRKEPGREQTESRTGDLDQFRDPAADFYFTKHARCRMKCRHITQEEVKEIVRKANVNYRKSELDSPQGPKYALEGYTSVEKQHVRIIVAPKKRHLTIVTVIDLDYDWECPSCK